MTAPTFRYGRLGYAALRVTDLSTSLAYYRDQVGLMPAGGSASQALLRCSDKPYDLILEKGDVAGLARIGLEVQDREQLERAFARMKALGHDPVWTSAPDAAQQQVAAAFRFHNPDTGLELDFYTGQAKADRPFVPTVTKIARLGHVVMNVSDYKKAHKFWVEDLGFAISDHVPGRIAFLRCFPNPLHHTLALISAEKDGLNHINFMVTDIDDIGIAMNRMKKADIPIVFGPGRHLPSTSIFLYFLDPDGMTTEYSFGMELIEEEGARDPRILEPKPEVLDTWGSLPDPRFGKRGEIIATGGGAHS